MGFWERKWTSKIQILQLPEYSFPVLIKSFTIHFSKPLEQGCRPGDASDPEMRRDVGVMPAIQGMIEAPEVKLVR
jgi:hypothetical protein